MKKHLNKFIAIIFMAFLTLGIVSINTKALSLPSDTYQTSWTTSFSDGIRTYEGTQGGYFSTDSRAITIYFSQDLIDEAILANSNIMIAIRLGFKSPIDPYNFIENDRLYIEFDVTSGINWYTIDFSETEYGSGGQYDSYGIGLVLKNGTRFSLDLTYTLSNEVFISSLYITPNTTEIYNEAFNDGVNSVDTYQYYDDGYNDGYLEGFNSVEVTNEERDTIIGFAGAILGAGLSFILYLGTEFELFGVNLLTVLIGFITISLALFILKKVIG